MFIATMDTTSSFMINPCVKREESEPASLPKRMEEV
jgi:hypothetical protein